MVLRAIILVLCLSALAEAMPTVYFDAAIWYDEEAGTDREASITWLDNTHGDIPLENHWVILPLLVEDQVSIEWPTPWDDVVAEYPWLCPPVIRDGIKWSIGRIGMQPEGSPYPWYGPITFWETLEQCPYTGGPLELGEIEGGVGPGLYWYTMIGGKHFHSPATATIAGELYVDDDVEQNFFGPIPEPATIGLLLLGIPALLRRRN